MNGGRATTHPIRTRILIVIVLLVTPEPPFVKAAAEWKLQQSSQSASTRDAGRSTTPRARPLSSSACAVRLSKCGSPRTRSSGVTSRFRSSP